MIIGIDLGTTNSLVAIFEEGQPTLLPNAHGQLLTPSVVGLLPDGHLVVGAAARELRVTHPDRVASCFKRHMGSDMKMKLGGQEFSAIELSSLVLRALKEDAEKHLGKPVFEAVITVPAYFNELQRKATSTAGEMAGLKVRRIINEPTAAALAYGFHDRAADSKSFLVFDLGGGTFDVTVMELFEGTLQIMTTAGENFLGGEDFTEALALRLLKDAALPAEEVRSREPLRWARLLAECERAKRSLSDSDSTTIRIPDRDGRLDTEPVTVSRELLKSACSTLLQRLLLPTARALRDAELRPEAVTDIVLVGGATRSPLVQEWVKDYFRRDPLCRFNPDHVVALGAAVQAALIADDKAVEDMVMTDVCPFTLGVEISRRIGPNGRRENGYFMPIIHRNTVIPVSCEESVSTCEPGQTQVDLEVYQGEGRRIEDNLHIGKLEVKGLPVDKDTTEVQVRFSYDMSGLLEVEAIVPKTGKRYQTVIAHHAKGLSEDDKRIAMQRLAKIKFYPRDDAENQRLLRYCNRIFAEVDQRRREALEGAIMLFEQSMASGKREFFAEARTNLLCTLESLGLPWRQEEEGHG